MSSDPQRFVTLYPIVLDEVARHDHAHSHSCTKAVLWLKRCATAAAHARARAGRHAAPSLCSRSLRQRQPGHHPPKRPLARPKRLRPSPAQALTFHGPNHLPPPPLPRSGMEFMLSIMGRVLADPSAPLAEVTAERYAATLHRWHGFLAASAFNVRAPPGLEDGAAACMGGVARAGAYMEGGAAACMAALRARPPACARVPAACPAAPACRRLAQRRC